MIDEKYLPPKSLADMLAEIKDKGKRIGMLMGVMRWCFNGESITMEGAEWIMSQLNIRAYPGHSFLKIKYKNIDSVNLMVIEKDSSVECVSPDSGYYQQLLACTRAVGGKDLYSGYMSSSDFLRVLRQMAKWLKTEAGKRTVANVFSWGELNMADDGDALFRIIDKNRQAYMFDPYDAHRSGMMEIVNISNHTCSGCNEALPCAKRHGNGQVLCNSCVYELNPQDSEVPDCSHIECAFGCNNYDERMSSIEEEAYEYEESKDEWDEYRSIADGAPF